MYSLWRAARSTSRRHLNAALWQKFGITLDELAELAGTGGRTWAL